MAHRVVNVTPEQAAAAIEGFESADAARTRLAASTALKAQLTCVLSWLMAPVCSDNTCVGEGVLVISLRLSRNGQEAQQELSRLQQSESAHTKGCWTGGTRKQGSSNNLKFEAA